MPREQAISCGQERKDHRAPSMTQSTLWGSRGRYPCSHTKTGVHVRAGLPIISSLVLMSPSELLLLLNLSLPCPVFLCYSGVESPTHEIRADAAPSAHSAKSIIITLASKHTFDRPVEILLHPSGMVPTRGSAALVEDI